MKHKRFYNRDEVTGMLFRAIVESGGNQEKIMERIDALMDVDDGRSCANCDHGFAGHCEIDETCSGPEFPHWRGTLIGQQE